jgi:GntR family transcriptional regulator, transcriptional repressor for pyruvate dehydrogenase complex
MSLTDQAIVKIRELITSGELHPGDRLAPEPDLARRLGLSRSSLREAVRALTLLGVLKVRQGDGTYVTSLDAHRLLDVMAFVADLVGDRTVPELVEIRRLVEPAATAEAAAVITEDQLATLRKLMVSMESARSVEELVEADAQFHDTIVQATGNSVLATLLRGLSIPTRRARIWHGTVVDGVVAQTHAGHAAIYHALETHDAPLAQAAALSHIALTQDWLRAAAGTGGDQPYRSDQTGPISDS